MDINSIEAYESFKDDLRQCDKCKSMFHIDDVFLDISEICDATNTEIEIYEKMVMRSLFGNINASRNSA